MNLKKKSKESSSYKRRLGDDLIWNEKRKRRRDGK
jgi:hypothetical protein